MSHVVLVKNKGFDLSVWGEHVLDLLVTPAEWNVLHIDVVDEFSNLSSVLWLELDGLDGIGFAAGHEALAS